MRWPPAPTPQTQNVVQTVEKQLTDQRQPFLSFQAPLRLCSKVSEAAALLPAVRVLLAPAALPIQMHFLTVIAEVTTPTASRGTKISSSNNVTVAQLLAYTLL